MKSLLKKILPKKVLSFIYRLNKKRRDWFNQGNSLYALQAHYHTVNTSHLVQEFIDSKLAAMPELGAVAQTGKLDTVLMINTCIGNGGAAQVAVTVQAGMRELGLTSRALVRMHTIPLSSTQDLITKQQSVYWQALQHQANEDGLIDLVYPETFDLVRHPYYEEADVVHLHNLHGYYFSLLALPSLSQHKPVVWTLHDEQVLTGHCAFSMGCERWQMGCGQCPALNIYPSLNRDSSAYLWQLKKQVYAQANVTLVVPSRWLYDRVKQSPLFAGKDVRLIYNGIDVDVFKLQDKVAMRQALGLPLDKKIILFSADGGSNNPFKGGNVVYELYNQMADKSEVLFVNIGGAKEEKEAWLATPYVYDRAELAQWYAAADMMLYPSFADNCPLVVAEAMACGLPVVTFATGGIPELVVHLESGYVADYKDNEDLLKGLNLFLNDDALRKKASVAARERVVEKFNEKTMMQQYLELYKELTGK